MTITEKTAYLKGLLEGMNFDQNTNEGKLFAAIADLLDELCISVADLEDQTEIMGEELDLIEESLDEIDEIIDEIDEAIEDIDDTLDEICEYVDEEDEDDDNLYLCKKRAPHDPDKIYNENIFFFCENNREIYAKELPKGKKHKLAEAPFDVKGMFFHEGTLRLFGTHLEYAVAEVSIAE